MHAAKSVFHRFCNIKVLDYIFHVVSLAWFRKCCLVQFQLPQGSPNLKDLGLQDGDVLCEGVDVDDVALIFDSGYEIPGNSEVHSRYNSEDGALSSLVMEKNLSVSESNGHVENTFEVVFKFLILIVSCIRYTHTHYSLLYIFLFLSRSSLYFDMKFILF